MTTNIPGIKIIHYAWIFCKSFKKWRNTPEETSFPLQGKTREQQRTLRIWCWSFWSPEKTVSVSFKPSLPPSTSVSPQACKLVFKWQLSHLKSCSALSVQCGFFWSFLLDDVFLSDSDDRSTGGMFNKAHSIPRAYFFPFVLYLH